MNHEPIHYSNGFLYELMMTLTFVGALALYIVAAVLSNARYRQQWPLHRYLLWFLGLLCVAVSVIGPLANRAHLFFTTHMIVHLLLGMLAPLLLALAAPMTLLLRSLRTKSARKLSRILRSKPVRLTSDPTIASSLNIGGLWLLYTTTLYQAMHTLWIVHVLVHIHIFLAGYLFTVSMIYIDPAPHRTSFVYRAVVLVLALAGHGILSKHIYTQPPAGISAAHAELGGMLMYYGGDAIDITIMFILCLQWFKATRPRTIYSPVNAYLWRSR